MSCDCPTARPQVGDLRPPHRAQRLRAMAFDPMGSPSQPNLLERATFRSRAKAPWYRGDRNLPAPTRITGPTAQWAVGRELQMWLTGVAERVLRRVTGGAHPDRDPVPLRRVPRRVLAVKVHGVGDSVMIRSLLESLARRHPEMEIGVLAGAANRELLGAGARFRIHTYSQRGLGAGAILRSAIELRRCRYEAVLNFEQGSLAGTAFLRAVGIPIRVGFLPLHDTTKAAFLSKPLSFRDGDSMWASFIRAVRVIDAEFPEAPPVLPVPMSRGSRCFGRAWLEGVARSPRSRRVALHVGSGLGQTFKRWPLDRFVALADRLCEAAPDLVMVLTGTPSETPLASAFIERFHGLAVDATVLGSIERTAAVLAQCDLLVSNDTGVMHLGAAMGTPTVGIFGPVGPGQWAPVGQRAVAVAAAGVACSPCTDTYRLRVPRACANPDHMRCLRDVRVEDVLEAARAVVVGGWLSASGRLGAGG